MNMFATQGGVVELWVTKTDTYTSTKTGEIYASVQSIAPIDLAADHVVGVCVLVELLHWVISSRLSW